MITSFGIDKSVKILFIDTNFIWVDSMTKILSEKGDFKIVGRINCIEELGNYIKTNMPDIVLMNADNVDEKQIAIMRNIKFEFVNLQILPYASNPANSIIIKFIRNGSNGFLIGIQRNYKELLEGLEKTVNGIPALSPKSSVALVKHYWKNHNKTLTKRENIILEELRKGKNSTEVAITLEISVETVRTHISNIYNKLGVSSRAEALAMVSF